MPLTPSPKRRAHMLQAHALRARGFTISQIARETDHAPATVHAWLRDFELQREHLVAALAQDQLLVLLHSQTELLRLHELHPPQSPEHAHSRHQQLQTLSALARELRLVCAALLRAKHDHIFQYEGPQDLELSSQDFDAVAPIAQIQTLLAQLLQPPPQDAETDSETESNRIEPNPSGLSERQLEISERAEPQSPVHNDRTAQSPEKRFRSNAPAPPLAPKLRASPSILPRPPRHAAPPRFAAAPTLAAAPSGET